MNYLHQEETHNEGGALTISNLSVVDTVGLHHVEQRLLSYSVLLLEEFMLGIGPSNVSSDNLHRGGIIITRCKPGMFNNSR